MTTVSYSCHSCFSTVPTAPSCPIPSPPGWLPGVSRLTSPANLPWGASVCTFNTFYSTLLLMGPPTHIHKIPILQARQGESKNVKSFIQHPTAISPGLGHSSAHLHQLWNIFSPSNIQKSQSGREVNPHSPYRPRDGNAKMKDK